MTSDSSDNRETPDRSAGAADLNQLRRHYRRTRNALTANQQLAHTTNAAKIFGAGLLSHLPTPPGARVISSYLASDGELATTLLNKQLLALGHRLALPVISAGNLEFAQYFEHTELRSNRYNIDEPAQPWQLAEPSQIGVMLVPLVAFDWGGNRLGMGGGYFDRFLGAIKPQHRPLLIGLAHECQNHPKLTPAPWDVPLDAILTERRWIWLPNANTPKQA